MTVFVTVAVAPASVEVTVTVTVIASLILMGITVKPGAAPPDFDGVTVGKAAGVVATGDAALGTATVVRPITTGGSPIIDFRVVDSVTGVGLAIAASSTVVKTVNVDTRISDGGFIRGTTLDIDWVEEAFNTPFEVAPTLAVVLVLMSRAVLMAGSTVVTTAPAVFVTVATRVAITGV